MPHLSVKVRSRSRSYRYTAYGLTIVCDRSLPELAGTEPENVHLQPRLTVQLAKAAARVSEPSSWLLQTSLPDGQPWMWAAEEGDHFLLRYVGMADFLVDREGTRISLAYADSETSRETIVHLLLDQALPMVLGLRGIPTLHASSVVTSKGVCAFLGPAGAGKSTIAASFAGAGYPVVGDDCLAIREDDGIQVIPAYPGLRLWSDSAQSLAIDFSNAPAVAQYTRKRRIAEETKAQSFGKRLEPLTAIYCLARDSQSDHRARCSEPVIEPLGANEAFLQLLSASFMLDITDRKVLTNNLRFIERLLNAVPVRRLRVPNQFSSLPRVREVVLEDVGAGDHPAISPTCRD